MTKTVKRILIGSIAFVVLLIVIVTVTSGNKNTANTTIPSTTFNASSSIAPAPQKAVASESANAIKAAPKPSPSTPALTSEEQQAVSAAQNYLGDGQGFSRFSLEQQLTSSYGDGFSESGAEFAVSYLAPDWYAQAVDAAKGYMSDGEGFSASSLEQQLTSTYGNGFTQAEAEYAVRQVGL